MERTALLLVRRIQTARRVLHPKEETADGKNVLGVTPSVGVSHRATSPPCVRLVFVGELYGNQPAGVGHLVSSRISVALV